MAAFTIESNIVLCKFVDISAKTDTHTADLTHRAITNETIRSA